MPSSYKPLGVTDLTKFGLPPKVAKINMKFTYLRIQHNKTQGEWAKIFKVSTSMIKNIERGRNRLTLEMIMKWSQKYNWKYDRIFE